MLRALVFDHGAFKSDLSQSIHRSSLARHISRPEYLQSVLGYISSSIKTQMNYEGKKLLSLRLPHSPSKHTPPCMYPQQKGSPHQGPASKAQLMVVVSTRLFKTQKSIATNQISANLGCALSLQGYTCYQQRYRFDPEKTLNHP